MGLLYWGLILEALSFYKKKKRKKKRRRRKRKRKD
jgi:hypothetical protein